MFSFLEKVDAYIHLEVLKIYPDAELPTLNCARIDQGCLELSYRSNRPFVELAHGLLLGCIDHFAEPMELVCEFGPQEGSGARFLLKRCADAGRRHERRGVMACSS
jgi:hypothetical protein